MCGVRTGPGMMIADGGGACTDVRWYCLDVRGPRALDVATGRAGRYRYGTAGGAEDAAQAAGLPRRHPVSTGTGPRLPERVVTGGRGATLTRPVPRGGRKSGARVVM